MSSIVPPTPLKRCTKCGQEYPATTEFFHRHAPGRDGLKPACKTCRLAQGSAYNRTAEGQAHRQEYRARPEAQEQTKVWRQVYRSRSDVQEHEQAYRDEYYQRPEVRARQRTWAHASATQPQRRASVRKWRRSPQGREWLQAYSQRPDVIERRRQWEKEWRQRPEVQARHKERGLDPEYQRRRRATTQASHNRPHVKAHRRAYFQRPDVRARVSLRRQAGHRRRTQVPGTLTVEQIQAKLKAQRYACYYCLEVFPMVAGRYMYELDHTVPISRAEYEPRHDVNFVVLACRSCNASKNNKLPHEWPEGGRLL